MEKTDHRYLVVLLLLITLPSGVLAGNLADNPLQPLYNAKKVNWNVQIDGYYPELSSDTSRDKHTFREGSVAYETKTFYFDVSKPSNVQKAYLYITMSGYDCQVEGCEPWTVRFNGNDLAESVHTDSIGPNPRGDGGEGGDRQTIRFDVTGLVANGENALYIRGEDEWQLGSEEYVLDGIFLVTFYETQGTHEYWVYDGVEYLRPNLVTDDFSYTETLTGATYPAGSKGTLYTLVGIENTDGNESKDAIYFNDNLLEPSITNYLLGTENSVRLDLLKFDVTDHLDGSDTLTFTYKEDPVRVANGMPQTLYANIPTYIRLFILDVDTTGSAPPEVAFTNPSSNSSFYKNQSVYLNFTVSNPDASVKLKINGSPATPNNISAGMYSYSWNLSTAAAGRYNITAEATDSAGKNGTASIMVEIIEQTFQTRILEPADGTFFSSASSTTIEVYVSDPDASISIKIDGREVSNSSTYLWDLSNTTTGLHTISAIGTLGNETDRDTIVVNVTALTAPVTPAPTTPPPTTSPPATSPPTTTPPTTTPPVTQPPVTPPPVQEIELAVNSITLSTGSSQIVKGSDFTVYVIVSLISPQLGDADTDSAVTLYNGDDILGSKSVSLKAYESRELEFKIRGTLLGSGEHILTAKVVAQGEETVEKTPSDNERSLAITMIEKASYTDNLGPYLKWGGLLIILVVIARIAMTFITSGGDEYLR